MRIPVLAVFVLLALAISPVGVIAQDETDIQIRADALVHKFYMDGIPYAAAHALGPEVLPYLFELLENPEERIYWTNIVVTIGFIEDASAVDPLIDFLEGAEGEVDGAEFRALLSVPYALGCIAAGGGDRSMAYLNDIIAGSRSASLRWQYRGSPVSELVTEHAVMGLAVSGRPEARQLLRSLHAEIAEKGKRKTRRALTDTVPQALSIMERIDARGRAAVLNPQWDE